VVWPQPERTLFVRGFAYGQKQKQVWNPGRLRVATALTLGIVVRHITKSNEYEVDHGACLVARFGYISIGVHDLEEATEFYFPFHSTRPDRAKWPRALASEVVRHPTIDRPYSPRVLELAPDAINLWQKPFAELRNLDAVI